MDRIDDIIKENGEKLKQVEQEIVKHKRKIVDLQETESDRLEFIESSLLNQLVRYQELQTKVGELKVSIETITKELVSLNKTKKNLEAAMTLVQKIRLVDVFVGRIEKLMAEQKYSKVAQVLLGCLQLTEELRLKLQNTKRLILKLQRVDELRQVLWNSVLALFKSHSGLRGGGFRPTKVDTIKLAEAALIVDVLGAHFRKILIDWYVEAQLKDYKELFRGNLEMASLSKLTNRFYWLQRLYTIFTEEHEIIFMPAWNVKQELTVHFCALTSKDLADMLRINPAKLNAGDLWERIREVKAFEQSLMQLFPNMDKTALTISGAFEGYMGLFIQVQEEEFSKFLTSLPATLESGDIDSGYLVASAPKFFLLMRDAWEDTLALGSLNTTKGLIILLNRILHDYSRYLQEKLPKRLSVGKALKPADVKLVCTLLSTANYSIETTESLNSAVQDKPEIDLALDTSVQSFHVLSSLCMAQLDLHTELLLQSSWDEMTEMLKQSWNTKSQVGDQSPYILKMQGCITSILQQVRNYITRPSTLERLATKLTKMVLDRLKHTIFDCKPISTTGAQQLLVDLAGLKEGLCQTSQSKASLALNEELRDGLNILEGIIKTVLLPSSPPKTFIEGYLLLVGDASFTVFEHIIQLKSISKEEHTTLEQEFKAKVPEAPSGPIQSGPGNRLAITNIRRPTTVSTTDQVLYKADQMLNRLQQFNLEDQVKKLLLMPRKDNDRDNIR